MRAGVGIEAFDDDEAPVQRLAGGRILRVRAGGRISRHVASAVEGGHLFNGGDIVASSALCAAASGGSRGKRRMTPGEGARRGTQRGTSPQAQRVTQP